MEVYNWNNYLSNMLNIESFTYVLEQILYKFNE
jgi:hypothetical protein